MRGFFRYFKGLHIWLLADILVLALFFLLRPLREVMNAVSRRFSMPLERFLGRLCAPVPFSVAELCYALAVLALLVWLARSIFLFARAEYRAEVAYRRMMLLANTALTLYAVFCLLWGVNFYADDFCRQSGIYPQPVAYDDLVAVTRYFAEQTAQCAGEVPRHADGTCAISRQETLDRAETLYRETLYEEFPFLIIPSDPRPKPIFFSRVMSAMNVTGLYFPFTGESNLNMDFPVDTFPATVAHELAHRRGIASEQQCNFLAILASVRSDDPAYRYSGWLMGYIHLSNALYTVSSDAWYEIRAALPEEVNADIALENAYWAQFAGKASKAAGKAYDTMLKSYGDELGMKSYGAVADLLVVYFRDMAK